MNMPSAAIKHTFPFLRVSAFGRPEFERRDCAVRALAIATGLSYGRAHDLCHHQGRRARFGFNNKKYSALLRVIGFTECVLLQKSTLADAQPALHYGRFVIYLQDHFMAVIHGTHMDMVNCPESSRRIIKWAYKLEDDPSFLTQEQSSFVHRFVANIPGFLV